MKNELLWSIIIAILLVAGAFLFMEQPAVSTPPTSSLPTTTTTQNTSPITVSEVKKHNTISDCWLILNNKAYNVTSFIGDHPGGLAIVPFCGKDGTDAYNAIRGGAGHSSRATQLLSSLYVGDVQ